MKAVFLDRATLMPAVNMHPIEQQVDSARFFDLTDTHEILQHAQSAEIIITNKVVLGKTELFALAPSLKLICVAATGYNHIDLITAQSLGISVSNVPAYSTTSVVQHTFALMLNMATNIHQYAQSVEAGRWSQSDTFCLNNFPITELSGKTLGIIGYGDIGRAVATVAKAFGMKVLLAKLQENKHYPESRLELSELLPKVDYLSIHCPLNAQTDNLITAASFELMKSSAKIINTARGRIVNEGDLAQALLSGKISGAALDVLSTEPPAANNPLLQQPIPNLLITPHTAWASIESQNVLVDIIAKNIQQFKLGQPSNTVS